MASSATRLLLFTALFFLLPASGTAATLRVATFVVDVTPPLGAPLCDALVEPARAIDDPLSARGIILIPGQQPPIALLAVDWVGIGNEGHDRWREAVALALGTSIDRVSVHALHQHDAPGCDFLAERIAAEAGLGGAIFPVEFAKSAIARVAAATAEARQDAAAVTHLARGKAKVEQVASNRRILGENGKVAHVRYTSCKDPAIRAFPEGTIDPYAKVVSFWQDEKPLAVLSYYATHPQSYYGNGRVSADFVGMARTLREKDVADTTHVHFNGAGGNIGAGKYNDGSPENRPLLAARLAKGMQNAWDTSRKLSLAELEIDWETRQVALPLAEWLEEDEARRVLHDKTQSTRERVRAARDLAWAQRCRAGHKMTIGRLRIGPVDVLHLPGELFVEYQLAAQRMRPQSLVCTAAYGDYGCGYIGERISYAQGGYETSRVSRVSPRVEDVLLRAIGELMR